MADTELSSLGSVIKIAYEGEADTNAFTDANVTTLGAALQPGGALGTPSSGVATNLTGTAAGLTANTVTTNANLTGHITSTGNATVLNSFTKSQLSAAVSDGTPLYVGDTLPAVYNNQVGTTYTIQASDAGKIITCNNGAAIAVTLPDGLAVNFQCTVIQVGAGKPTVTRSGTDTVNGAATGVAPAAQWKALYLSKYDTAKWLAIL